MQAIDAAVVLGGRQVDARSACVTRRNADEPAAITAGALQAFGARLIADAAFAAARTELALAGSGSARMAAVD